MAPRRTIPLLAGLFLLLAAANFARNPALFSRPPLPVDDAVMFQRYYNAGGAGGPFYYATTLRYLAVVPQLVGYGLVNALDVRRVPAAFSLSSLLLLTAAYLVFASPLFAGRFPHPGTRAAIAALMALAPSGAFALISSVIFQGWTCVLIAVSLSLASPPRRATTRAFVLAALVLCAWSHPIALVALPVLLARAVVAWRRSDRPAFEYWGLAALASLVYLGVGLHPASWEGLAPRGGAALGVAGRAVSALPQAVVYSLDRVVVESLLGHRARIALIEHGLYWLSPLAGLGVAALVAREIGRLRRSDPAALGFALAIGYYVLALSWAGFLARPHVIPVMRLERAFRYCYVQKHLWLLLVVFALQPRLLELARAGGRRALAGGGAALAWLLALSLANNAPYRTYRVSPNIAEGTARGLLVLDEDLEQAGHALRRFLAEVRRAERELAPGERERMVLDRGVYALRLDVRPR